MLREMCKSKIHQARVTEANLFYTGSITIDKDLMVAADIFPYERVQIANMNNGSRLETYVIEGKAGTGVICMNGAAARSAEVGDQILIISYGLLEEDQAKIHKAKIVHVDSNNRIKNIEF